MTLLDALRQEDVLTENGMVTNSTSLKSCVDLFFMIGALRTAEEDRIVLLFYKAYNEDPQLALKILFWARDIRGGAGERKVFRVITKSLGSNHPKILLQLLKHIPEYGRWDDLLFLYEQSASTTIKLKIVELIKEAIESKNGLVAKWLPRKGLLAKRLRESLGFSPKRYRKTLVGLTSVVENEMCSNSWNTVEYQKVPSLAFTRYKKAFYKHDKDRIEKFIEKVIKKEATINVGAIYPYDLIKTLKNSLSDFTSIQAQWYLLPNYMEGADVRLLPVVDVSGSMEQAVSGTTTAMDIALSLGLYISERNKGPFMDSFVTFSNKPTIEVLKGTLRDRWQQMSRAAWSMNTNIEAVFKLILNQAVKFNISETEMPTHLLILSDMEFDIATTQPNDTAMSMIHRMYIEAGYRVPNIIFWNLVSRHNNVPVKFNQNGVALVSGFSPSLLLSLFKGEMNPVSIMNNVINVERYNKIFD